MVAAGWLLHVRYLGYPVGFPNSNALRLVKSFDFKHCLIIHCPQLSAEIWQVLYIMDC